MKKSIRFKLFLGISFLGIMFIFLSWFINTQYLEGYYLDKKKDRLLHGSKAIDNIYDGNPTDIQIELEMLESKMGSYIFILNKNKGIKYSSFFEPMGFNRPIGENGQKNYLRKRNLPIPPPRREDLINQKYVFSIQRDPNLKMDFLSLRYILNNGDMLTFVTPLAAMSESIKIFNNFLRVIGIMVIFLGIVFAYVFSRQFTRPILEINKVTQGLAKLNFKNKCSIETEDEIGELANSINYLSEQLELSISELNEKNEKLQQDIERERRIDEMRKEFISSVSHELKTPISLIQGYAEGLKVNVNQNEEDKNYYCDVIMDEAHIMDKLVKDLLNLSKLESGYFKLEWSNFNISQLVNDILEKYIPSFDEKRINLVTKIENNIIVNGDQIRIQQVLVNFINNAINHANNEKVIKVCVKSEEEKVRITVFNTGKNIPEQSLDKIWTSFYKVDKARTRGDGGSGLGLSIVKGILDLHGSSFGVNNAENGVEFWFYLDKKDN